MRKIILSTLGLFLSIIAIGQLKFKGSLIQGPTPNSVDIVISPTINFTGYLTNVVFTLEIPQGVTQPTITRIPLSTYFPSFNTFGPVTTIETGGTFVNYGYSATNTSITANTTVNAGVDYPVLRLSFSGGSSANIRLANLASGGPGTLYQFYVEANTGALANDYTNYVQMFNGPIISPTSAYPDEATGYASYQYVNLTAILPIKLTNFSATKKDKDAVLNWQVANQDANSSYFELERGYTGTDFTKIGRVDANLTSGSTASYSFTDVNIAEAKSNGVIFYRLKMVDKDGKFTYSQVRSVKLTAKAFGVNLYPNPAKTYSNVTIELEVPSQIILSISDAAGRKVQNMEFAGYKGLNQKKIDLSKLAGGSYMIKVNNGSEIQTISLVKE
ncbi:MAG TPA: T9SS type A sorting domain-containing protein [Chitinophagaceae bacterium]|nr:T9SS type A sorting domain-containing protein [Chitinophagaceae bacterium]